MPWHRADSWKIHAPATTQRPVALRLAKSEAGALVARERARSPSPALTAINVDSHVRSASPDIETTKIRSLAGKPVCQGREAGGGAPVGIVGRDQGVEEARKREGVDSARGGLRGNAGVRVDGDDIESRPADRETELGRAAGDEVHRVPGLAEASRDRGHETAWP